MNAAPFLPAPDGAARLAEALRESGEDFVRQAGVAPGMDVLDLGCGDGTAALPAAKLGARVLGVDADPARVGAARRRAAQAGLADRCTFLHGAACRLDGLERRSVDLVLSLFGVLDAPRPADVAREMVRVTRPGGRIVMAAWMPNEPALVSQLARLLRMDPGPLAWGSTPHVLERFGAAGIASEAIGWVRDSVVFDHRGPPAELADLLLQCDPPIAAAYAAAQRSGRGPAVRREVAALFEAHNQSQYPDTTLVAAGFLRVTVDVG